MFGGICQVVNEHKKEFIAIRDVHQWEKCNFEES
jgi:hypothetical protein